MRTILVGLLALSIGLNIWLGKTVAELENVQYGSLQGFCMDKVRGEDFENFFTRLEYVDCLGKEQTRTSALYHIAYALGLL